MSSRHTISSRQARLLLLCITLVTSCVSTDPSDPPTTPEEEPQETKPEPTACIRALLEPEPPALDILILLNRSLGMASPPWFRSIDILSEGLSIFADTVHEPQLSLGLQAFPPLEGEPCLSASYHNLLTPIEELPAGSLELKHGLARARTLGNHRQIGSVPLRPALLGAYHTLRRRLEVDPRRQAALVVLTDRSYYDCGTLYTWEDLHETLEREALEDPPIPTFIALPEGSPFLDRYHALARSGGTGSAFFLGGEPDDGALSQALLNYRKLSQACAFELPKLQSLRLDPKSVTLRFQESPEAPPETLPLLDDPEECRGGREGFYYEDPSAPRRLSLCPTSCAIAESAGESGSLKIDVGCLELIR